MADFRKLEVWRKSHELMLDIHEISSDIRGGEFLSLKSQIVRAAMSIPANIVEGRAQPTDRLFRRYVVQAIGSASELEYHLIAAKDLGAASETAATPLIKRAVQVRKMLIGLNKKLST
jgi:four helix bundle protein